MSKKTTTIKNFLGFFLGLSSNYTLRNKFTVFNFHDVSDSPAEFSSTYGLNVPPLIFDFQINFIKNNFNIISVDDLMNNKIPPKAALITFDDGLKSFFTIAIPILKKYKVPAIIFLNMEPIKGNIFWSGLITYLCKNDNKFVELLKVSNHIPESEKDLFIYCKKDFVEDYLKKNDYRLEEKVKRFVGAFANMEDINRADVISGIYFGNHLYNHYVPLLMTDDELIDSYRKNENELLKYKSYRKMFSYPFGQPETCFTIQQTDLIIRAGAQVVFSAYPLVNNRNTTNYFHRIALTEDDTTPQSIWFSIFKKKAKLAVVNLFR